ncbi:MAG: ribosome biogenesis GTP-binding protein YihA/YsxC [Desulfosudaceae bacterium]
MTFIIKSADFVTSAVEPARYPEEDLPEIAFAGRSNVGKSSLINCLVNRKNLVKTSSTPGKTRLINFFSVNDRLLLVDLPGYGYARVSRQEQKKWGPMVETYLAGRKQLRGVVLLIDLRRMPREEEFQIRDWLTHYQTPCLIVLTKADKLKKNDRQKQLRAISQSLGVAPELLVLFSAKTKTGRETILDQISDLAGFEDSNE